MRFFLFTFLSEIIWSFNTFNIKQLSKKRKKICSKKLSLYICLSSEGRKNPSTRKTLIKFLWKFPLISRKQSGKRKRYKFLLITSVRNINRDRYWHHFSEIQCSFQSIRPEVYLKKYFSELLENLQEKICTGVSLHKQPPEVFLLTYVLKICSKFTGKHPCRSAISKQIYWNDTSAWVFSFKFAPYFQDTFF